MMVMDDKLKGRHFKALKHALAGHTFEQSGMLVSWGRHLLDGVEIIVRLEKRKDEKLVFTIGDFRRGERRVQVLSTREGVFDYGEVAKLVLVEKERIETDESVEKARVKACKAATKAVKRVIASDATFKKYGDCVEVGEDGRIALSFVGLTEDQLLRLICTAVAHRVEVPS